MNEANVADSANLPQAKWTIVVVMGTTRLFFSSIWSRMIMFQ